MVSMFNNWGGLFFFFARSANDKIWYIAKRAWPHNKRLDYERVGVSDNIIMRPPPTCPPIECIAFYYSNCWLCVLWHKYQRSPEINTLHTLSGHTPHAVIYGQNLLAEVKSSFTFLGPRSELSPFCAGRRHRLRAARRAEQSLMSQTAAASTYTITAESTQDVSQLLYANASIRRLCDRANFPRLAPMYNSESHGSKMLSLSCKHKGEVFY